MAMNAWDEASPQKEGIQAEWQRVVDAISKELLREDEPVAWIDDYLMIRKNKADDTCLPLYFHPAPKATEEDEAVADAYELLAMELASEEHDDIHQLIYEGCPPEPWGEVWQRYEGEAKRLISLVTKYIHPTPKATEDDEPAGYLIHYREVQSNGRVLSCTQASLDRATPAIMLPEESNVESRKLLSSRPLYLRPAPKVPAGWQLVPKEPTDAMLMAGHRCIDWCRDGQNTYDNEDVSQTEVKIDEIVIGNAGTTCKQDLIDAWQAMLAAAPKGETE